MGRQREGETQRRSREQWSTTSVVIALAAISVFQLWAARGTLQPAFYLNDSSMHEQMVRFATNALRHGHFPMSQWYAGLDLGSPQFLHYQGLAATIAGALGLVFSPNTVFRWSLYLLWSFWPLVMYGAARVFTLPRRAALGVATVAAAAISVPLVGYEIGAYMWSGYGIWAQLCASWALPFAWAWTWRALEERKYVFHAVFFIALTASLHFETGYSGFLGVVVMALVVPSEWRTRVRHGAAILLGAILATSWITVPLLLNAKWAAINTALVTTGLVRGYGASQNLSWLFSGHMFDATRTVPALTIALGAGVLFALRRWRGYRPTRAFVVLFVVVFLLSFGPTTWGSALAILPGHADIYFRRFLLSVHLAGLFAAGVGIAAAGDVLERHVWPRVATVIGAQRRTTTIIGWGGLGVAVLVAALAYPAVASFGTNNETLAVAQVHEQRSAASALAPILAYVRAHPDGRVYAGTILNWGANFSVGQVQTNIYLADNDIDEVGFVLRTAALMEQPEYEFAFKNPTTGTTFDAVPADYALLGIHYLLTPTTATPPVPATVILTSGAYRLWALPGTGYFDVVNNDGTIDENKGTVYRQTIHVFDSAVVLAHGDYQVNWNSPNLAITPVVTATDAPGRVLSQRPELAQGRASASVTMTRPGVVVLAASYDPGWRVSVDGAPASTVMMAPALVGVKVPAGAHTITFIYKGFSWYWLLGLISVAGLGLALLVARAKRNFLFTS
jgi:hypothetical protein